MKIVIHHTGIVFVGKGRDIIKQLHVYKTKYKYVQEWVEGKKKF